MNRRQFCQGVAATGASAFAIGAVGASESSEPVPGWVSTRGHFDVEWAHDSLTDGHSETGYDIEGTIPGDEGASPDELAIMVHGWDHDKQWAREDFHDTAVNLGKAGYEGELVGFSWDSKGEQYDWWAVNDIAERNGPKLANFLREYGKRNPETTIRLIGHSLGVRVLMHTVETLDEWAFEGTIDSATFLGAAVGEDTASACTPWYDDRYGPELQAQVGQVDNFWKSDDETLSFEFELAEWEDALGANGLDGEAPENYADHQVDDVENHNAYFRYETGCADAIVDEW